MLNLFWFPRVCKLMLKCLFANYRINLITKIIHTAVHILVAAFHHFSSDHVTLFSKHWCHAHCAESVNLLRLSLWSPWFITYLCLICNQYCCTHAHRPYSAWCQMCFVCECERNVSAFSHEPISFEYPLLDYKRGTSVLFRMGRVKKHYNIFFDWNRAQMRVLFWSHATDPII